MTEIAHSKYSPSGLHSWELCPGYKSDNTHGPAAQEGTMLHGKVEKADLKGLTPEQEKLVNVCLSYTKKFDKPGVEVFKEVRLDIWPKDDAFGTADMVVIDQQDGHLIDYKFGSNRVKSAEVNLQGWCYAAGVFIKFPKLNVVTVHFVQPRLEEVTVHTFAKDDLDKLLLRITTVIERRKAYEADPTDDKLNPVPSLCLYCAAKPSCTKMHSMALMIAPKVDDTFELPEQYKPHLLTDPHQISKGLTLARVLAKWAEEMRKHATEMALNGSDIPYYDVVERAGSREIKDAQATYLALKDEMELTEYLMACSVSASQLEKIISVKAAKGQKGKAVAAFKEKLADLGLVVQGETVRYLQKTKN